MYVWHPLGTAKWWSNCHINLYHFRGNVNVNRRTSKTLRSNASAGVSATMNHTEVKHISQIGLKLLPLSSH